MAFNRLEKIFGSRFRLIFKTITFDNGSEFSRYCDIETSILDRSQKRTKTYFAKPNTSWQRGTNEIVIN